jgi:hypothetical protein
MLTLEFRGIHSPGARPVGPFAGVRVAGNFIRAQPGMQVVAQYMRHQWHINGEHFSRYDCCGPVSIYFLDAMESESPRFGPFEHLFAADGTMYVDGELFAKFIEETLLWHSFRLETHWPNLIIEPA